MSLRIATFNLKDFFSPRTDDERPVVGAKVANVAENLRRADADVVALQEVGSPELLDRLLGEQLAGQGYAAPVVGTPDKRGIRNAIVSRLPIQWSQVHRPSALSFPRFVQGDPDPFGGRIPLRRGVVHVRIEADTIGEIDVLTAHFKSSLGAPLRTADGGDLADDTPRGRGEAAARSLVQRLAEALYLRGLVDDILRAMPDHAICVLGDFNDVHESLPLRVLRGVGLDPTSRGALLACAELVPAPKRFSCMHGDAATLIDHILVSEQVFKAVSEVHIFNEALRRHEPPASALALSEDSDHALSVVTIET
jgi:endonuclease/exonuclease/phosphatase family metal-dependent hydrolase